MLATSDGATGCDSTLLRRDPKTRLSSYPSVPNVDSRLGALPLRAPLRRESPPRRMLPTAGASSSVAVLQSSSICSRSASSGGQRGCAAFGVAPFAAGPCRNVDRRRSSPAACSFGTRFSSSPPGYDELVDRRGVCDALHIRVFRVRVCPGEVIRQRLLQVVIIRHALALPQRRAGSRRLQVLRCTIAGVLALRGPEKQCGGAERVQHATYFLGVRAFWEDRRRGRFPFAGGGLLDLRGEDAGLQLTREQLKDLGG